MTSQEVRALIDAKIKGQGTNVDAGSVLPAILNGILDLIDSGGGGGTSDAVQYIPQILTSPQQMQARKNQGLYYEESGIGDKTITLGNDVYPPDDWKEYAFGTVSMDVLSSDIFIKMSDDTPSVDEWKDITQYEQSLDNYTFTEGEGYYIITEDYGGGDTVDIIIVVSDENGASIPNIGNAQSKGIYVVSSVYTGKSYNKEAWAFQNWDLDSITYEGTTTVVHQIPAKYVPQTVPAVKMEVPSMGDDVYYNMAQINVNQYVPSRDVKFSVEGDTVLYVFVSDVINGGPTIGEQGDTYTFDSGGLYWIQVELTNSAYACAMVYVESGE